LADTLESGEITVNVLKMILLLVDSTGSSSLRRPVILYPCSAVNRPTVPSLSPSLFLSAPVVSLQSSRCDRQSRNTRQPIRQILQL